MTNANENTIVAPEGARIVNLHCRVNHGRDWKEAISAGFLPHKRINGEVQKVGDLYLPTSTEEIQGDYIILNFLPGCGSWDRALVWAQSVGLKMTVPREVFAIGEQYPGLERTLGQNPLYLVATTDCIFGGRRKACFVWWGRYRFFFWSIGRRVVGLRPTIDFDHNCAWFLFRK
ncbi:MAG: hypothetical protein K8Q91_02385 [Candidatus Vogelbacteria bacterium]|nr:hypothetical protein [Candidatus Vogelbacteria bacterium]